MRPALCLSFVLSLFVLSCESGPECTNSDINLFDSFLGLGPQTKEVELPDILGESTGGYYSEDAKSFVYTYQALPDVPIAVAVNATTSKVETVLMEILSFGDDFFMDLEAAKKLYNLPECDSRFFGMKNDELIEDMGKPSVNEQLEGGINLLTYNSKNYKTSVNFKFYAEQDNMCSSVIVNWF